MTLPRWFWIVRKDLMEGLKAPMVWIPMLVLPLIFCVGLPALMVTLTSGTSLPPINGADQLEKILGLYPIPAELTSLGPKILYLFLNFTMAPFFLIIPIMVSSILAAHAITGEKERRTLETLLYTPLSKQELILGKLMTAFLPAMAISWGSFGLFFITANGLSWIWQGRLVVTALTWIPVLLLASPAVALLGLAITLLVSLKAKTFMEAQQASGLVVLPIVVLVGAQMTGLIIFNPLVICLFSVGLLGLDAVLVLKAAPQFETETLINTL